MEAVEYLVVGEEAQPQLAVDESFVQGVVDGSENLILRLVGQNLLQAFLLLLGVGKNVDVIALLGEVAERLFK